MFDSLTREAQVEKLAELGRAALRSYPVGETRLIPLTFTENMVFRVESGEGRFALRIHRPESHRIEEIRSEMTWLSALRRDTGLHVPDPVMTESGDSVLEATLPDLPDTRPCVLFRWVEGELLADRADAESFGQLGGLMAKLHRHSRSFIPADGFTRGRLDPTLFDAVADSSDLVWVPGPHMSPKEVRAAKTAAACIRDRMVEWGQGPEVFGLVHADLHPFNVLTFEGELRPIDFDDCGFCHFHYDMAIPLLMIEDRPDYPALRDAFLNGYLRFGTLDKDVDLRLETFMAARRIILIPWLIGEMGNPDIGEWAVHFVPRALAALQQYAEL